MLCLRRNGCTLLAVMKPTILFTYCLVSMAAGGMQILAAQTLSDSEIVTLADTRIQKYRTGDAQLRLVTPEGKAVKRGKRVRSKNAPQLPVRQQHLHAGWVQDRRG